MARLPPGKNGIEAGFSAALLAMMAQRQRVGVRKVSCPARIRVSRFAVCVNRKLQLPVRVAGKKKQGRKVKSVRIIPCAAIGEWG